MVTSSAQTLSDLDDLLRDLQSMVPSASRPLPSPPHMRPLPAPRQHTEEIYEDPNAQVEDHYELPPGPIMFPSPPPLSPTSTDGGHVEPNPLDILEQQMAALEALKEQGPARMSPSHTYTKPVMEMKQKKPPPKVTQRKPTVVPRPEPPKFAPNQGPADYLETTEVKPAKLTPALSESKKAEIAQLDKLLDSLNQLGNSDPPFVASLSYDHLGAEQGGEGAKYDLLHNAAVPSPHYEYPEVPLPRHTTKQEGDYSYPETRVNKNDIEEHFYEAIPLNDKSKIKEPSPYIEASALTTPKFTGMSGKAPPRPTYKPNEKSSDRLQGLNDLMASLEDIKPNPNVKLQQPNPNVKLQQPNPTKPSRPPNTVEDVNPYLSQLEAIQTSVDDNLLAMGSDELGELDSIVGTLQEDANKKGLDIDSQGTCTACKMPILGNALAAIGKQWHVDHFVCVSCDTSLAHVTFFEHNGQPYCEKDHQELFSPKCAYCNGSILDQVVTALNKTWHPEHFFCAQCGKSFGHEGFHEHKGKAYCTEDYYDMFAPRCGACGNAIMDGFISAMGTQWHPECFVCRVCHVPFKGGNIFELEGKPYCELHYHAARGTLCASCLKPVVGACVTALGKKYHPDHFKCAFCMTELNKGTFKEHQNKPYCHPCFIKLFG